MSPEIKANGVVIANVSDESKVYRANDGSQLLVDVSLIDAESKKQILVLEGPSVVGKRRIGLNQEGKGSSGNIKQGGDGQKPLIEAALHEPIRVTNRDKVWHDSRSMANPKGGQWVESKRTYYNPQWRRR